MRVTIIYIYVYTDVNEAAVLHRVAGWDIGIAPRGRSDQEEKKIKIRALCKHTTVIKTTTTVACTPRRGRAVYALGDSRTRTRDKCSQYDV